MPAYNFKKEFAADIKSLKKRCTIRRQRSNPTRAGATLYLYTGMRTKNCQHLRTVVCKKIKTLEIIAFEVKLNGEYLEPHEIIKLARKDGFKNETEFFKFFHKLYGYAVDDLELIEW